MSHLEIIPGDQIISYLVDEGFNRSLLLESRYYEYLKDPNLIWGEFIPYRYSLFMIILYLCIGMFGLIGNMATCIVIVSKKSMHTATNCYLFNLAVSDMMILIWDFPPLGSIIKSNSEIFCRLSGLIAEGSIYVSILTITIFSVERYMAICHPFVGMQLSSFSRATKAISVIWLLGFLCASPVFFNLGIVYSFFTPMDESEPWSVCIAYTEIQTYLHLASVVFFVIPLLLISVLYKLIGVKLRKSAVIRNYDESVDRTNRRVLKMLKAVISFFFICWAPYQLQRINDMSDFDFEDFGKFVYEIGNISYYSSCVINPILYNIMSKKYRQAFKETFLSCSSCLSSRFNLRINLKKTDYEKTEGVDEKS